MKHTLLYILSGLALVSCAPKDVTIEVSNSLDFDRNGELVSAPVNKLGKLVDDNGNEVAYQVTENGIVFQADVAADASATYTMKVAEQASPVSPKVSAFFLGDRRKDDFCWENDKAAYRMYGPALAPENPSNGVDLWLKHSSELTADAMYKQEEGGKPYHIDYGLGIDSYKVGHAVGCGGVALVYDEKAWVGGPYAEWEILQEGPLQTIFQLRYDSILVGETILKETLTVTVNAGAQVNKAEVTFSGKNIEGLKVGGGIFLHDRGRLDESEDRQEMISKERKNGAESYIAFAEPATSDKGIYGIHEKAGLDATQLDFGRNYIAVIVPDMENSATYDQTLVAEKPYTVGETFTYYFGGGWSKRDFATDEAWFEATAQTAAALATPLQVSVK